METPLVQGALPPTTAAQDLLATDAQDLLATDALDSLTADALDSAQASPTTDAQGAEHILSYMELASMLASMHPGGGSTY